MELEKLPHKLTVCKLSSLSGVDCEGDLFFLGKTDSEISLVCETANAPVGTLAREDGWRGFRIRGTLDFSLVGILSAMSATLAEAGIGIFAVSTYDTDYILVKDENFEDAQNALTAAGYVVS